ncbi:MAG TPA: hypothetical protein VGQ06_02155 [Gemmatimonadales bacterium]|jgi:hypothetical protein|nr:hypothetical protein [Gemmatimonadales bacterium]
MNANRMFHRPWLIPLVLLAWGCSDPSAVEGDPATPAPLAATSRPPSGGLVSCGKLPYDSVSQEIGPAGGVIAVGPHFLWIDSLALPSPVTITAVAPSDRVRRIRLMPDGLVFQKTAFLVTSYANCNVKQATTPRIAQVSDDLTILGYLSSATGTDTVFAKVWEGTLYVGGEVHHFSNYAIAW